MVTMSDPDSSACRAGTPLPRPVTDCRRAARGIAHLHPKSGCALCNGLTDPAHADDTQRPSGHRCAQQLGRRPSGPLTAAHETVAFNHAAGSRQDQGPRQIRCGIREHIRRIGDDNSPLPCGVDVDVVVADGIVGHNFETTGGGQDVGVEGVRQRDNRGDRFRQPRSQGGRGRETSSGSRTSVNRFRMAAMTASGRTRDTYSGGLAEADDRILATRASGHKPKTLQAGTA